jgi:hypothetical protein
MNYAHPIFGWSKVKGGDILDKPYTEIPDRCTGCGKVFSSEDSVKSEVLIGEVNRVWTHTGQFVNFCKRCKESWKQDVSKY